MQKKQTILVVASLLLIVLSVTLAYFTAQIIGKGKNVTINSADLKIIFTDSDGSISGTNIEPGKWNVTKTFTIENKSNETYKYNIVIQDLVNTFVTNGYLQYKITSTNGGYNMTEFKDVPKSETATDTILAYSASIDVGVTQSYTVEFIYKNDESVDQSDDMGKTLSGKLFITEGTVKPTTLYEQILADNPTIKTRTTFTAFTETNTGTLYKATEQIGTNPVKDVYYFAGDAKNNWVKFGKTPESSCTYKEKELFVYNDLGFKNVENQTECETYLICNYGASGPILVENSSICSGSNMTILTEKATWNGTTTKDIYWRIIRTNHDGSIKLLYAGTSPDTTRGYIRKIKFNTPANDPMYVGYKYGTSGSLENNRLNTKDSTIKTYIDNWYKNNLTAYTKYLSNDAVYCNDRNLASGQTYSTSTTNLFNYASFERIYTNKQPTYNCTNMGDAFSVNNTSAKLDYPIGLMSIDELSYAGGQAFTTLDAPYAWYYTNANGKSITGSESFWSLTPNGWHGSFSGSNVSDVWLSSNMLTNGFLYNLSAVNELALRPSVSLSSCNLISGGDGSANNPYVIKTDGSSC